MKITVLGAGSWGVALAMLLKKNGHDVAVWSLMEDEVTMLQTHREHIKNLPGIKIDDRILITNNAEEAISGAVMVVFAVPSRFVRSTASLVKPFIKNEQIIINVGKGLEDQTLCTLEQVLRDVLPNNHVAVLSGPSHAEEVAKNIPTSVVAACIDEEVVHEIQHAFMNENFRVYGSTDVIGVEMGGSLKNVIALAAGISDGLGFGDNSKAALMTRGMAEISRLGLAMGGEAKTYNGLSGIGDLIVTCTSMHSRNRRAGILLGKGYTLEEAQEEVQMVVEGVYAARAALALAKNHNVEMPIIEEVNAILFEGKDPKIAVRSLMERDRRFE